MFEVQLHYTTIQYNAIQSRAHHTSHSPFHTTQVHEDRHEVFEVPTRGSGADSGANYTHFNAYKHLEVGPSSQWHPSYLTTHMLTPSQHPKVLHPPPAISAQNPAPLPKRYRLYAYPNAHTHLEVWPPSPKYLTTRT